MLICFAIFSYYTVIFAIKLVAESNFSVEPADTVSVQQFISQDNSKGTYIIVLPDSVGQPELKIASPSGTALVEKQLVEALTMDTFPLTETGNYVLTLANTSPDKTLKANIVFGDQKTIIENGLSVSPDTLSSIFNLAVYTAIAVIIAGVVLTVLDRQHLSKMRQFGDTSDLV